eukprot:1361066-Alexandrium_andersonii.AAC.1
MSASLVGSEMCIRDRFSAQVAILRIWARASGFSAQCGASGFTAQCLRILRATLPDSAHNAEPPRQDSRSR